jgi:hypothetical protein
MHDDRPLAAPGPRRSHPVPSDTAPSSAPRSSPSEASMVISFGVSFGLSPLARRLLGPASFGRCLRTQGGRGPIAALASVSSVGANELGDARLGRVGCNGPEWSRPPRWRRLGAPGRIWDRSCDCSKKELSCIPRAGSILHRERGSPCRPIANLSRN